MTMLLRVLSLAALIGAGLGSPARAEFIGVASAVQPDASSTPPAGGRRVLRVGANVMYGERIVTSPTGSAQLLFVDKSTFNIGPNSDLVIDEFVYDPGSRTGRVAATLAKGTLRFVGGQTSHTGGATIRTPATTLGVRGGVVTLRHDSAGGTRVVSHYGRTTIETANGPEVLRRSGYAMTVGRGREVSGGPARVSAAEMADSIIQPTRSRPGGRKSGGSGNGGGGGDDAAAQLQQAVQAGAQSKLTNAAFEAFKNRHHHGHGNNGHGGGHNGHGHGHNGNHGGGNIGQGP